MKSSLANSLSRVPLKSMISPSNSLKKLAKSDASQIKKTINPSGRFSGSVAKDSGSDKNQVSTSQIKPLTEHDREVEPQACDLLLASECAGQQFELNNINLSSKPNLEPPANGLTERQSNDFQIVNCDTKKPLTNPSVVHANDHERCLDKQQELVAQYRAQGELQSQEIVKRRAEVAHWREAAIVVEAEIANLKGKNVELAKISSTQTATILSLRQELILLQRKLEYSDEAVANEQLETIALRREQCSLRSEAEELRKAIECERREKETHWAKLLQEKAKQQYFKEGSSFFNDQAQGLTQIIEKMRDEMHAMKLSNEETLKLVSSKSSE